MSESFEGVCTCRAVRPPEEYYDRTQYWPPGSLERRRAYLKETR